MTALFLRFLSRPSIVVHTVWGSNVPKVLIATDNILNWTIAMIEEYTDWKKFYDPDDRR